jgi:O-antigen/teichoic acid export membrane protein
MPPVSESSVEPLPATAPGPSSVGQVVEPPLITPSGRDDALAARQKLDRSFLHGLLWTGIAKWGGQVVSWASTFIVARILSPDDYGLVGMATLYIGLLNMVTEFGIGVAVVRFREMSDEQLQQMHGASLLLGVAGTVLAAALGPALAAFFDAPRLKAVVFALSVTFFLNSIRAVPAARLSRDLRFKRAAAIEGLQILTVSLLSVALAMAGARYWTLVVASIVSSTISVALILVYIPQKPSWPRLERIRPALRFGRDVIFQRISWYVYSNADFMVAGKLLGKEALGAYTMAWTISSTAIDRLASLLLNVSPPVLSAVQNDLPELRRYIARVTEALSAVVLPLTVGIALTAPTFVPLLLGQKWQLVVVPLQILSSYAGVRALTPFLAQVLLVRGDTQYGTKIMTASAIVMPAAFFVGARWGLVGIAAAWVIVHPFLAMAMLRRVLLATEMPLGMYVLEGLSRSLTAVVAMATAVAAARALFPLHSPIWELVSQVAVGAVVYCGVWLVAFRARLVGFRTLIARA